MAGIKRSAQDILGREEKKIHIDGDTSGIDGGAMTYIIENPEDLGQEEGITLEGDDASQYITNSAHGTNFEHDASETGTVQIVSSGADEGSFITADGHIITQNEDSELVINTEDGQQVLLQENEIDGSIDDTVQTLEMHNDGALTQIDDIGVEQETVTVLNDPEEEGQYQNLIIQHMDISEPLTTLRKLLEQRLGTSLATHQFYLQDVIPLDPSKNLTSQCVQGTGMVQINVEVKSQPGQKPRLNIVDILKPAEEVVEMQPAPSPAVPTTKKVVIPFPEESENVTRWIVDQNFRREQERLKIPFDPVQWNEAHVRHWIQWAVKEFSLDNVDVNNFTMNGKQLCELRHEDFIQYIPSDKGDVFWTHLELLRKCKFVATIQQPTPHAITTITVSSTDPQFAGKIKNLQQPPKAKARTVSVPHTQRVTSGNRTGNNGQIQLWQFLLELLTDKEYAEVIHWVGDEGEFKLNNPEVVAQLWGQRKNKPTMNYEKLSRALRYYYDGDMIAKVHGKRFVYKFVCDLSMLLGYSASELRQLVNECVEKHMISIQDTPHRRIVHSRPIILHSNK